MSLPALDNFNRSDAFTLGANWTVLQDSSGDGMWVISNKVIIGATNYNHIAAWNADAFADDQYSQGQVYGIGGGSYGSGFAVRCSGSYPTPNCYAGVLYPTAAYIFKITAGSIAIIAGPVSVTPVDGDLLRVEASGAGDINVVLNGSSIVTVTDSASPFASGSAGLFIYGASDSLDNWEGGNLGGGGGGPPVGMDAAYYYHTHIAGG